MFYDWFEHRDDLEYEPEKFRCPICLQDRFMYDEIKGMCDDCFNKEVFKEEPIKKYIAEKGLTSSYNEWLEGDESTEEYLKEYILGSFGGCEDLAEFYFEFYLD